MSTVTDRVRLHRSRQRAGLTVVMFEVDEESTAQVLTRAGFPPSDRSLSEAMQKFWQALIATEAER